MAASDEKRRLRERFRSYRDAMSLETYERLSRRIVQRADGVQELQHAATVHVYWPVVQRREVDTRPLIANLRAADTRIVLPRVPDPPHAGQLEMEHIVFDGAASLARNTWGIDEPTAGTSVHPDALDAVVVPCLGAGMNGHRIGHGFGYYDAFLRDLRVPRICLTYEGCLVQTVPAEPHDVPMTHIVTERRVLECH